MEQTRLDGADFEGVQLVADIDLASLKGTGYLVPVVEVRGFQHSASIN